MKDLLSFNECDDILRTIRYRPEYSAYLIHENSHGSMQIVLKNSVTNTYTGKPDTLNTWEYATAMHRQSDRAFINFVHDTIIQAEAHERDEWFIVGDRMPFDPHSERSLDRYSVPVGSPATPLHLELFPFDR